MVALDSSNSSIGHGHFRVKELKLTENAEQKSAEFIDRMWQITLEALWTDNVRGEEGFERTDSTSEGLGAGWTASFLAKSYPGFSRYLTNEFLKAVVEFFIVVILGMFVTFGVENFVKRPAVLLIDGIQILRLDGILTLIAITHGNLRALINLTRCPEQMRENVKKIDTKRSTTSWTKIWDPRHTLIKKLLQQYRFGTGKDTTIEKEEDVRRYAGA